MKDIKHKEMNDARCKEIINSVCGDCEHIEYTRGSPYSKCYITGVKAEVTPYTKACTLFKKI